MRGPDPNRTVILLAEDEPVVRNLVRTMLCQSGYAVLAANDGAEALAICKAFPDEIHLFLTDVNMPLILTGVLPKVGWFHRCSPT
jgi:CheY-like chemotaxis protein